MSHKKNFFRKRGTQNWEIQHFTLDSSFDVSPQTLQPNGVSFKADGTKMFVSSYGVAVFYEYDLSPAWDITSAVYNQTGSIISNSQDIFFKADGTKMYGVSLNTDRVYEYNLSTAWDVTTISLVTNKLITANPTGVYVSPDGTKMYVSNETTGLVYEYDLSTPWSVATATLNQTFDYATGIGTLAQGLTFKTDGTKMYINTDVNNKTQQYDLSTAWDISSCSLVFNDWLDLTNTNQVGGFYFKDDGAELYTANNDLNIIQKFVI